MSTAYEKLKRSNQMKAIREQALQDGVTLRPSGLGVAAMSGYGEDGSVWVWSELTNTVHQVAGPGTVDLATIPDYVPRGVSRSMVVTMAPGQWE